MFTFLWEGVHEAVDVLYVHQLCLEIVFQMLDQSCVL